MMRQQGPYPGRFKKENAENKIGFMIVAVVGTVAGAVSAIAMAYCDGAPPTETATNQYIGDTNRTSNDTSDTTGN